MDKKAKGSFRFYTRYMLSELTGERASDLEGLLRLVRKVPDASIYHHTHRYLQQHQYLSPEPPNDFAYWVGEAIGEDGLAERLASIDTVRFSSISRLRGEIELAIEKYLKEDPDSMTRRCHAGEEFNFIKAISFIIPTEHEVNTLREFLEALKIITIESIYFHIFEARLRLERGQNDFSLWLETSLGEKKAARRISRLDHYT
ncbi:MAG: DUF5752 family protein [Candidatus Omnitrophica bacterium]|nr:DUF5752 family protein [Candidatus Omnitrophota bacterium]